MGDLGRMADQEAKANRVLQELLDHKADLENLDFLEYLEQMEDREVLDHLDQVEPRDLLE